MTRLIDADKLWMVTEGDHEYYEKFEIDESPTVDAIPIEWIKERIKNLNEYISRYGGVFEQEHVVDAKIHEVGGLIRLIADWQSERKEE